jgi:hypothetical protein
MDDTAREQILEAVGYITRGGRQTFTIAEVITELERRGSQLARSTIRTHIASRMCANAPDHHGTTYDDFERVDHGEYRLLSRS